MGLYPEIKDARREDIAAIVERVRPDDAAELWALYRMAPAVVLEHSLALSAFARTGFINGEPVCMYGVARQTLHAAEGAPWMVGTVALDEHASLFLRRCKGEVRAMLEHFPRLANVVDVRNRRAVLWLRWLGFEFGQPTRAGVDQILVLPFHKEADDGDHKGGA